MRESIFFSSIRAFVVTLATILGFCAGIILLALILGAFSTSEKSIERTYSTEILPNADEVRKVQSHDVPVILQLNVEGAIGTDLFNMNSVRKQLIESREGDLKNKRVKAILLRINSPGGTVNDANAIYHAIKSYKERYEVPVYAFVDGMAASGGMMVACAADKIFATDVSLIGSVGVIVPSMFNLTQLIEKIGVESATLYAGKHKDDLNPFRPWRKDEEQPIQELINYYYDQFVDLVVANRPRIQKERLIETYGAKVFNPILAEEYGYIDGVSTRSQVLKMLLEELKIEDDKYQVVELKKERWFLDLYANSSNLLQGKIVHQIQLPSEYDQNLMNQFLYLYRP